MLSVKVYSGVKPHILYFLSQPRVHTKSYGGVRVLDLLGQDFDG